MKDSNRFGKLTYNEFKNSIKSYEDLPTIEDFLLWASCHRTYIVFAINHMLHIRNKFKKIK